MGGVGIQMSRFFVSKTAVDEANNRITITGEDVKHIKNVLRMAPGESVVVCDCEGTDYVARLEAIEKDAVTAKIEEAVKSIAEPDVYITLFQGIPKSDKMDFILQKSVELGVSRIVPVITERTVVRFDSPKDMENKRTRWQRICMEAAKQCNRGIIPEVALPVKFPDAVKTAGMAGTGIIPYEKETCRGIGSFLADNKNTGNISVFIGPEGGFSEKEVQLAAESGIQPVTLGPRILRTETAGMAVISIIMYEIGDMGA